MTNELHLVKICHWTKIYLKIVEKVLTRNLQINHLMCEITSNLLLNINIISNSVTDK